MAALLYKHYLIIATGQFAKAEGWLSVVDLSWGSGPDRGSHVIHDSSKLFQSRQEAEIFAVEIGKAWVDERYKAHAGLGHLVIVNP
jgi:hypothetical protein